MIPELHNAGNKEDLERFSRAWLASIHMVDVLRELGTDGYFVTCITGDVNYKITCEVVQ